MYHSKYRLYSQISWVLSFIYLTLSNNLLNSFNVLQLLFMKEQLREVEKHVQPGLTRYTWLSLGIEEYARDALNKLRNVTSRVNQMQDVTLNIDKKIISLGSFDLFNFPQPIDLVSRLPCKVGSNILYCRNIFYKGRFTLLYSFIYSEVLLLI